MRRASRALLALMGLLLAREAPAQEPRDSIGALRAARQEQARFETLRRRNLPWGEGGGSGECDERIGRFCLTYDDGAEWSPPPDPPPVVEARAHLVEQLAALAGRIPGDHWVTGQRVRYLVDARRFADARAAAGACRAEPWWCAGLTGFATHYAGDAAAADSAFSEMLRLMPPAVRDRWTDLSDVLGAELVRYYKRLSSDARRRFAERYWALADPFYGRPGNEVRAEHLARNLLDDLQDRAKSADNLSWGADLREILVRYGWPTGWERVRDQRGYAATETQFSSHYADTDQDLLPPGEVFLDSAGITAGEWDREDPEAHAAYAIPMADSVLRWLSPLDHQVAVFTRRDSALVVAAYQIPTDSLPAGTRAEAALVVTADGERGAAVTRASVAGAGATLSLETPARPALLSLEVVMEPVRRAARLRRGLEPAPTPPGRLGVSDLLLLRGEEPLPGSLEAAMPIALGSTRLRPLENVGLFWEVYGLQGRPAGDGSMTLRVVAGEKGWLRRAVQRTGLVRGAQPGELHWQESLAAVPILGRALSLQIPPLPPGRYTVELTVSVPGEAPATGRQEIQVVE